MTTKEKLKMILELYNEGIELHKAIEEVLSDANDKKAYQGSTSECKE